MNTLKRTSLLVFLKTVLLTSFFLLCGKTIILAQIDESKLKLELQGSKVYVAFKSQQAISVKEVSVQVSGKSIPTTYTPYTEETANRTAILFLINTSTFNHQRFDQGQRFITDVVMMGQPRHLFGVYGYEMELVNVAPLGTPHAKLTSLVDHMQLKGIECLTYQRMLDAIEILNQSKATRKSLVLISTGSSSDKAWGLQDVVNAVNKTGVDLVTVGLPDNKNNLALLQNLERMAKDGQGLYINIPEKSKKIPETSVNDLLRFIENGGTAQIDVTGLTGEVELAMTFTYDGKPPQTVLKKIQLPAPPAVTPKAVPTPDPKKEPETKPDSATTPDGKEKTEKDPKKPTAKTDTKPVTPPPPPEADKQMLYIIIGVVVLGIIGLIVVIILKSKKKPLPVAPPQGSDRTQRVNAKDDDSSSDGRTRRVGQGGASDAYIELMDAQNTRYPLAKGALRIGRSSDNDIVFKNDSVSSHHAEIHARRDGTYQITDLGSTNGVYINGEKHEKRTLTVGDTIEIGELKMRFRQKN